MSTKKTISGSEFKKPRNREERTSQLFVLPPDLLQKLGINLEIGTSETPMVEVKCTKKLPDRKKQKVKKKKHAKDSNKCKQNEPKISDNNFGSMSHIDDTKRLNKAEQFTQNPSSKHMLHCESDLIINAQNSEDISKFDQDIANKPCTSNSLQENINDTTSILETCSLFKESVLLSPSFADTAALNTNQSIRHEDNMAPVTSMLPEKDPVLPHTSAILKHILSMPINKKVKDTCMVNSKDCVASNGVSRENCVGYNIPENKNIRTGVEVLQIEESLEYETFNTDIVNIPSGHTQIFPLPEDLHIVDAEVDIIQMSSDSDRNIDLINTAAEIKKTVTFQDLVESVNIISNIPNTCPEIVDNSAEKPEVNREFQNINIDQTADDTVDEAYLSDSISEAMGEDIHEMWDATCNTIFNAKTEPITDKTNTFRTNSLQKQSTEITIIADENNSTVSKSSLFNSNKLNDKSCNRAIPAEKNLYDLNSQNTCKAEQTSYNAVSSISPVDPSGSDDKDKYVPIIAKYLRRAVDMLSLNRKHDLQTQNEQLNKYGYKNCHTSNYRNMHRVENPGGSKYHRTYGKKKINVTSAAIPRIHKKNIFKTYSSGSFDEISTSDIDVFETETQSTHLEFSVPHFGEITHNTDLRVIQSELEWSVQPVYSDEPDTKINSQELTIANIQNNIERLKDTTELNYPVLPFITKATESIHEPIIEFAIEEGIQKEVEMNKSCIVSAFQDLDINYLTEDKNKENVMTVPSFAQANYNRDYQYPSCINLESESFNEPNVSISDNSDYLHSSFIEKISNSGVSWTDIQGLVSDCNFPSDFCRSSRENSDSRVENECDSTSKAESGQIILRNLGLLEEDTSKQQYGKEDFKISYKQELKSIEHIAHTSLPSEKATNRPTIVSILNEKDRDDDARLDMQINEILDTHFSNDGGDFEAFEACVVDEDIPCATSNLDCNLPNADTTVIELLTGHENVCMENSSQRARTPNDVHEIVYHSFSKKKYDFAVVGNPELLLLPLKKREVVMSGGPAENSNMPYNRMEENKLLKKNYDTVGKDNINKHELNTNMVNENASVQENKTAGALEVCVDNTLKDKSIEASLSKKSKSSAKLVAGAVCAPHQSDKESESLVSGLKVTEEVIPIRRPRGRPPKKKNDTNANDSLNIEILEKIRPVQTYEHIVKENMTGVVKCGVCHKDVEYNAWMAHSTKEHNYLAWAEGDSPIDVADAEAVVEHLQNVLRSVSPLVCTLCGVKRTNAKGFWKHLEQCLSKSNNSTPSTAIGRRQRKSRNGNMSTHSDVQRSETLGDTFDLSSEWPKENNSKCCQVGCGVCKWQGSEGEWFDHICKQHEYVAWKEGEMAVDVDTTEKLHIHLKLVLKQFSKLTCKKCGLERKYLKHYLKHVQSCKGPEQQNITIDASGPSLDKNDSALNSDSEDEIVFSTPAKRRRISSYDEDDDVSLKRIKDIDEPVKCGRCQELVQSLSWFEHSRTAHGYLAWKDGEEPFDFSDEKCIKKHLRSIIKKTRGFTCPLCDSKLTSVEGFVFHSRKCQNADDGTPNGRVRGRASKKIFVPSMEEPTTDMVKCAVCSKEMKKQLWKNHLQNVHYNMAWFDGGVPLDINDHNKCTNILTELVKLIRRPLVCRECGASRMSGAGFYAHIIVCQKTEEEIEALKYTCDVCNRKYLRMYRVQHAASHRVQEKVDNTSTKTVEPDLCDGARRRAAVAAKANIEKMTSDLIEGQHSCSTCGFLAYTKEKYDKHNCERADLMSEAFASDGNSSNKSCGRWQSESEESDSDVDSDISAEEHVSSADEGGQGTEDNEETEDTPKDRFRLERTCYTPGQNDSYYRKSCFADYMKEFCTTYLTTEQLFPELKCKKLERVPTELLAQYLPPLEQSCQTSFFKSSSGKTQWKHYEVFQSDYKHGLHTMFAGGPISALCWAPPVDRMSMAPSPQYVAITCQRDPHLRGLGHDQLFSHPGLIQIWSFDDLDKETPAKFVLGLAHDHGTVWSLDWCPSGAREELGAADEGPRRLGLLAAACSDGSVYIYPVLRPSWSADELPVHKTRPLMELRLCSGGRGRKAWQATVVHWSMQKGHSTVGVGYADGTVALYNLNVDSPVLKSIQDNVTIIHPYFDSQVVTTSVSDLTMYPTRTDEKREGVTLAVSCSNGVVALCRAGAAPAAVLERRMTCTGAVFAPHWPTVVVTSDDLSTGVMAMEWCGDGQRVCAATAAAVCMHTSRLAAATATSQLVLARGLHPAATQHKKRLIGTYGLAPLYVSRYAKVKAKDNLEVMLEPNTYDEVIKKYGIVFTSEQRLKTAHAKLDRYPLAAITHLAFCPSAGHFNRLAIGNAAGFVLVKSI